MNNPTAVAKWDESVKRFFEKAKIERKTARMKIRYWEESEKLFEPLKQVTSKYVEINVQDIFDALTSLIQRLHYERTPPHNWDFQQFKKDLEDRLMSNTVQWVIFFRIGDLYDFREGYRILRGRLYSFEKLPKKLRTVLLQELPHLVEIEKKWYEDEQKYKARRLKEWYIKVQVSAVGQNKAVENAVTELNKIIAVMKFFRFIRLHETRFMNSPYDYQVMKHSNVAASVRVNKDSKDFIDFIKPLDIFISKINSLKESNNIDILDNRILESIIIFGNIDKNTPIEVRFMLCVIALETLLIGKNESGSKRSLLAERIAFLLGDTKDWFLNYYRVETVKGYKLESSFTKVHLKEARQALLRKILKLYDSRSAFAHSGISAENITQNYYFASSILLAVVQKLLKLHNKGITRLETEYDLILRWESIPTTRTAITKYKKLQNLLESFEKASLVKHAKILRDKEKKKIYITGIGKKSLVIFLNESGAALIEYDGKAESMMGRCLEYFDIRKDGEQTFLAILKDSKSPKQYINNIKFGKAKTYWER